MKYKSVDIWKTKHNFQIARVIFEWEHVLLVVTAFKPVKAYGANII